MDEAEYLGDRVAIMSQGKLVTCGSPLFLKGKYSDNFLVEIKRKDNKEPLTQFEEILTKFGGVDSESFQKETNQAGNEVYKVSRDFGTNFNEIFTEVDAKREALNIDEYIVRTSSLEEVFIQIG
jgi:ATP-binding cassette subfamily A (ABC1) protein 3